MTGVAELPHLRRRPGRPRDRDLEQRVIAATVALLLAGDMASAVTVSAITTRAGVSRAALYRRWGSREELIAAALDSVRSEVVVPDTGNLMSDLVAAYTYDPAELPPGFDRLLRKRLVLALEDPQVQRMYWRAHVSRRRVPVAAALQRGIDAGLLRADLDIDAAIDLIAGVFYYQLVVRGEAMVGDTQRRVHDAIRLVWRGMLDRPEVT